MLASLLLCGPISSSRVIYEKKLINLLMNKEKNCEQLQEITESELRNQLKAYGFQAGPIDKKTKGFYINKLKKLKCETSASDSAKCAENFKSEQESNKFVVKKVKTSELSRKNVVPVKRICLSSDESDIEQMDVD